MCVHRDDRSCGLWGTKVIQILVPGIAIAYAELYEVCLHKYVDMGTKWMSNRLINGELLLSVKVSDSTGMSEIECGTFNETKGMNRLIVDCYNM